MARVLITGVAGFIGSSLARALLAEGAEVRGVDNLSTGTLANLEEIAGKMEFREADVQDAGGDGGGVRGGGHCVS